MKHYCFECYDEKEKTTTRVEFETDNDAWSGFDGPMWKFFEFLKGCGYVFHHESQIGVLDESGEFREADEVL